MAPQLRGSSFKKFPGQNAPRTLLKIRACTTYGAHLRGFGAQVQLFQISIRHLKMLMKTLLAYK